MADHDPHHVDPGDEGRHPPEDDPLWNESVYLDFVAGDGTLAGYARIGLYPNLGVTWWTTVVVGGDRPLVHSVAFDLPVPGTGWALGGEGTDLWFEVVEPLATVRLRGTAPAGLHADPTAVYRGESGEPTTLGLDLTWVTDGTPFAYDVTTRYEIPCVVAGSVVVGDQRLEVDGHGQRDHSWGVRDWWSFGWCWSAARLDDGTRVHLTDVRIPGLRTAIGYRQAGGVVTPLTGGRVDEEPGPEGLPRRATATLEPAGLTLDIEPIAFGPVLLVADDGRESRFPRAVARFTTADGRTGTGWIEWNQPPAAPPA
jgi:hypothetical protein